MTLQDLEMQISDATLVGVDESRIIEILCNHLDQAGIDRAIEEIAGEVEDEMEDCDA